MAEVERRVGTQRLRASRVGRAPLDEVLAESLYHERRRLKEDRTSRSHATDTAFWDDLQGRLKRASAGDQAQLLAAAIRHYAGEIAGNFDDRVYQLSTRVVPPALGLLLNAVSPKRILARFPDLPRIDDAVILQGETAQLQRLTEIGTVILVPTHVSNLDSIIIGYALYRLGLPPFIYGAGLNLFSNPLIGFFMDHLGAYTVDRKKTDPLYKDVLKEYATLTLEYGYHNLFFPGGTRCRSGAIERRLKMGLLGTGVAAYVHNLKRGAPSPKIFIVPATLSYQLVLEAETLIDDFLKEVGKARYIIEDDEFSRPRTVLSFASQLLALDSRIEFTVGRALDPFGNEVDGEGHSLDPRGRRIDPSRYVLVDGAPAVVPERDAEYTRELAERITDAYSRDNVVASTNVLARVVFGLLRKDHPRLDLLRLLRAGDADEGLDLRRVYEETDRLLTALRARARRGEVRLGAALDRDSAEDVVADGLRHFAIYHTRPAVTRRGARLHPTDRNLLLYYQNRLEGYGLEDLLGIRPTLSPDHRAIAQAAA